MIRNYRDPLAPVGYTFAANVWCPDCTATEYPEGTENAVDFEGNPVHAIAPWEYVPEDWTCGGCGDAIG